MKRIFDYRMLIYIFLLIFVSGIIAQPPQLINYQALLTDPNTGKAIPDSMYTVVFSIYNVSTGGTAIWTETQSIETQDGLFNALLGSVNPITPSVLDGPEKYLGVKVGMDPEMTPRRRIVSSAYSIISEDANKLNGLSSGDFSTSDNNPPNQGSNLVSWDNLTDMPAGFVDGIDNAGPAGAGNTLDQAYDQSGPGAGRTITADAGAVDIVGPDGLNVESNLGIATTSPTAKLDVRGDVHIGSTTENGELKIFGVGSAAEVVRGFSNSGGGRLNLQDEAGNQTILLENDANNEGGWIQVLRSTTQPGVTLDGNYQGTKEPRLTISGSSRSVSFNMDQSGDASVLLPVNGIGNSELLDEPGVASNIGSGFILGGSVEVLLFRSIVCPISGYVLVLGTCEASFSHTNGTTSNARFGVSNANNSFPSNQDVELRVSSLAPSAAYNFPVTVHGLFQVNAGTNTLYFLAQELNGDFSVFDSQLSLIFFPTAYGTVTPTQIVSDDISDEHAQPISAMSPADIAAERMGSESTNSDRIEAELARMQTEIEALKNEIKNGQKNRENQ